MAQRVISAIFLLFLCFIAEGQQFPVIKLTVEEGLGHSIVYRTYQSKNGYMWFSTDNGITRYDGATLTNYTTEEGLRASYVFGIQEDDDNLLICTLGGGVMKLQHNRFVGAYDSIGNAPHHPIDLITNRHGTMIIDRFKNLHIRNGDRFELITLSDLGAVQDNFPLEFFQVYPEGTSFFILSNYGVFIYEDRKFVRVNLDLKGAAVLFRMVKHGNTLYGITDLGLVSFDLSTGKSATVLKHSFSRYARILLDSEFNLWISTVEGKLFFLKATSNGSFAPRLLLDDVVLNDIFEDKERNIWLSTYGEGVWFFQSTHIRNYPLKGGIVSDLIRHDDEILIPTINAGLKCFRQEENQFLFENRTTRLHDFFESKPYLTKGVSLPGGDLLLSSATTVYRWSKKSVDSLVLADPVSSMYYQRKRNRLIVGSRFSVTITDSLLRNPVRVPDFSTRITRAITEDFSGNIILGTDKGLWIEDGNVFRPLDPGSEVALSDVNSLHRDPVKGTIWVGTNRGLATLKDGKLSMYDHPLTRVRCNSITGDDVGRLWIGTVKGLLYFNGSSFELISIKDGLPQSNVISVNYQEGRNMITLLSPNYLTVIDNDNLAQITTHGVPGITIETVQVAGHVYAADESSISIPDGIRQVTIRVGAPQIRNRDKIRYSYRINNKPWNDFDGREIALHAIPFGELTITVKAFRHNREQEFSLDQVRLFVPPPFYLRWWFILLAIAVLAVMVATFIVHYAKRRNRNLIEENKRLDIQHKALRNLLNPHFLYNAINSIHAFVLHNDQKQTLGYLSKFSQLVRLNLDLLATDQTSLDKEIKNISLYLEFEKLRFANKLNYTINIDPEVLNNPVMLPSFIIQPFVENAIWHGLLPREEGGNIMLSIRRDEDRIAIVIEDDGIGINQSINQPKTDIDKKTSMGINIIRERFELLRKVSEQYSLSILDKREINGTAAGTGTKITITIPAAVTEPILT